ncbi:hypothetical protein GGI00_005310, partial [Coemansia sp. RSA 2681]
VDRFVLSGANTFANRTNPDAPAPELTFETGEMYTIDCTMSTGSGVARASTLDATVYQRDVSRQYALKLRTSRALLSEVSRRCSVFPFLLRDVVGASAALRAGVQECVRTQLLVPFAVTVDKSAGAVVAQFKATVMCHYEGPIRITRALPLPAAVRSATVVPASSEIGQILALDCRQAALPELARLKAPVQAPLNQNQNHQPSAASAMDTAPMRLIDIGANLTDPVFRGTYRGTQAHPDDLALILERARAAGVAAMVVTGGSLEESRRAIALCRQHAHLYATVGCHPTRTSEVAAHAGGAPAYFAELHQLIAANRDKVVAVGECGLDYDRLHFSDKPTQLEHFASHFELARATGLPMFLHDRNTQGDFARLMRENRHMVVGGGVVHSFTGSIDEAQELLELGLYIGINGCSLKTEDNLAAVRSIPVDRLMIETDCPYCEI